jgi:hypothetical protein
MKWLSWVIPQLERYPDPTVEELSSFTNLSRYLRRVDDVHDRNNERIRSCERNATLLVVVLPLGVVLLSLGLALWRSRG